ncbi:MAG: methyltransferase domain-containing protein [Deltaproteobacteria bacterium]|nr:methyltransferase domain-containing protein [Deltaproteobacteria bacterium]
MLTDLFLKMLNREASSPVRGAGRIFDSLGITEGQTIADIGSGGGYFTLGFAQRVGESGRVFAVDTKQKYLNFIRRQSEQAGLGNIEFVLAESDGVDLPISSADLIFARNVFHHLSEPTRYFRNLGAVLKPAGRVAIIDHMPKRGFSFVSLFKHFTPVEKIREIMESAGYVLCESFNFLPGQSFLVFCCLDEKHLEREVPARRETR